VHHVRAHQTLPALRRHRRRQRHADRPDQRLYRRTEEAGVTRQGSRGPGVEGSRVRQSTRLSSLALHPTSRPLDPSTPRPLPMSIDTLANVKTRLGVTTSADDTLLNLLRDSADDWIVNHCGLDFGGGTYTEYHPGGTEFVHLRNFPVQSVTSVNV